MHYDSETSLRHKTYPYNVSILHAILFLMFSNFSSTCSRESISIRLHSREHYRLKVIIGILSFKPEKRKLSRTTISFDITWSYESNLDVF